MSDTKTTVDNYGNEITIGCTVAYSHNMWRGKEVMRKGTVKSIAPTMITVQEPNQEKPDRVKITKVLVI